MPIQKELKAETDRRRTPPRRDALRHSGDDNRRCTSATVTLYLDVELSNDSRPGTEQNRSPGASPPPRVIISEHGSDEHLPLPVRQVYTPDMNFISASYSSILYSVLVAQRLGRRTFHQAVAGSIPDYYVGLLVHNL